MTRDEVAEFTALVQRQSRFAFRVAYAVLLNSADAEDAVQEAFLKLHRHGEWQQVESERAFVARIVWRTAVDHIRSGRSASALRRELDFAHNEPRSLCPNPEEELVAADQQSLIHTLIDGLPEELRLPLVLFTNQELNSREIAGILEVPEGTVRTRIQRARTVLRDKLQQFNHRRQETRNA